MSQTARTPLEVMSANCAPVPKSERTKAIVDSLEGQVIGPVVLKAKHANSEPISTNLDDYRIGSPKDAITLPLALVRELCAKEPFVNYGWDDNGQCGWCLAFDSFDGDVEHKPTCPYRRLKEALEAHK